MRFVLFAMLPLMLGFPLWADTSESAAAPEDAPVLTACQLQAILSSDFGDPTIESDCTARCQDGSTRTCSGSTCAAQDTSCYPTIEQGYCWSDLEGYKYCNDACTCSPSCEEVHDTGCHSGSTICYDTLRNCKAYTCVCYLGRYQCP